MPSLPSTEFVAFPKRHSRSEYVASRFSKYFSETLLDVGCYEAPLRSLLSDIKYTGVDFVGNPDIQINLEEIENLPFKDGQFDTVICIEVLEHLVNLHRLFDELIRVSNHHIIISLPNCWRDARVKIEKGRGSFAHYGLPVEKPNDRHKWFFNFEEALNFVTVKAKQNNLKLVEIFATEKPKAGLIRSIRKIRYPGIRYMNRYCGTIWAVFEKM
jgi:SAM-dependent methyltransferase